jgi:hypothetical protein
MDPIFASNRTGAQSAVSQAGNETFSEAVKLKDSKTTAFVMAISLETAFRVVTSNGCRFSTPAMEKPFECTKFSSNSLISP